MTIRPTIWKAPFAADAGANSGTQSAPTIVGLSNGNFLVAWTDENDTAGSGAGDDIIGRIFNPLGETVLLPGANTTLQLNTTTTGEERLVSLSAFDGGFVAAYHQVNSGTDKIFLRRVQQ
ncbi:MAG: hypothetical protein IPL47_16570 [Phyllobacteriaceae bacterium]|nr:hypothetical protein [Phyllobacteriaceae bacterium]